METPLLTAREVADRFAVSVQTVYRWAESGALPVVRLKHTSTVRFRESDVESLVAPTEPAA